MKSKIRESKVNTEDQPGVDEAGEGIKFPFFNLHSTVLHSAVCGNALGVMGRGR